MSSKTMTNTKKAVVLLSGGLDSLVSLANAISQGIKVELALIFNYGQKAFVNELNSARKICEFYNVPLKVIQLDWLKDITNTALVSDSDVPNVNKEVLDDITHTTITMKSVWVPNRNGLFVNIAASFCDSFGYDFILKNHKPFLTILLSLLTILTMHLNIRQIPILSYLYR